MTIIKHVQCHIGDMFICVVVLNCVPSTVHDVCYTVSGEITEVLGYAIAPNIEKAGNYLGTL